MRKQLLILSLIFVFLISVNYASANIVWYDNFTRADSATVGSPWTDSGAWNITSNALTAPGSSGSTLTQTGYALGNYTGIKMNDTTMTGLVFVVNSADNSKTAELQLTNPSNTQWQYHNGAAFANCGSAYAYELGAWFVVNRTTTTFQILYINDTNIMELCTFTTTRNWASSAGQIQFEDQQASTKRIAGFMSANTPQDFQNVGAVDSITLNSVSPLNYSYSMTATPVFTFNITAIRGTWNTTLWLNNSNSYGSNLSLTTVGVRTITSTTIPSGEYLWWINATFNSSFSVSTEKRNIYIAGAVTSSCVQTLTNAYFVPDGCTSTT